MNTEQIKCVENIGRHLLKSCSFEIGGVPIQHFYYCQKCGKETTIEMWDAQITKPEDREYLCEICFQEKITYGEKTENSYYQIIKELSQPVEGWKNMKGIIKTEKETNIQNKQ